MNSQKAIAQMRTNEKIDALDLHLATEAKKLGEVTFFGRPPVATITLKQVEEAAQVDKQNGQNSGK